MVLAKCCRGLVESAYSKKETKKQEPCLFIGTWKDPGSVGSEPCAVIGPGECPRNSQGHEK